jgi:hypothetical protein
LTATYGPVPVMTDLLSDTSGISATWDNHSLPDYLKALAGWLADCDGYYANRGIPVPWNGWQVVQTAMTAATVYE